MKGFARSAQYFVLKESKSNGSPPTRVLVVDWLMTAWGSGCYFLSPRTTLGCSCQTADLTMLQPIRHVQQPFHAEPHPNTSQAQCHEPPLLSWGPPALCVRSALPRLCAVLPHAKFTLQKPFRLQRCQQTPCWENNTNEIETTQRCPWMLQAMDIMLRLALSNCLG